jgi:hypothetical protein
MKQTNERLHSLAMTVLASCAARSFLLGFHRRPRDIQNFEAQEYGRAHPFVEPVSVVDSLAVYAVGSGASLSGLGRQYHRNARISYEFFTATIPNTTCALV